jgi:hypothetical protein
MVTSPTAQTILRPRFGPRPLVVIGMILGAAGMLYLSRLDLQSSYAIDILPALVVLGAGLGLVFSSATNSGTLGVQPRDASVASATVNASQQVGASLGTALLSTLSASATASYLTGFRPTPATLAAAEVHGYAAAFAWTALFFLVGAVVAALLYRHQVPERHPAAAPAVAH